MLFHNTIRIVNLRDYTQQQVEAWASGRAGPDHWHARLAGRTTRIAAWSGSVIGFTDIEPDGHLDHLFVHHNHQRQGVATALHEAIEAEARRLGLRRLFTEASITARPFFLRQGYQQVRQQVVTIDGVGLTNFVMEKDLAVAPRSQARPE